MNVCSTKEHGMSSFRAKDTSFLFVYWYISTFIKVHTLLRRTLTVPHVVTFRIMHCVQFTSVLRGLANLRKLAELEKANRREHIGKSSFLCYIFFLVFMSWNSDTLSKDPGLGRPQGPNNDSSYNFGLIPRIYNTMEDGNNAPNSKFQTLHSCFFRIFPPKRT